MTSSITATVYLYTDGAASGNPGPGGFGTLLKYKQHEKEISGGFRLTTNNRMELLAVITGLEALKEPGLNVLIVSDSKYVVDTIEKGWLESWRKTGFKKKKNVDLWQRYLRAAAPHRIKVKWIKGHAGHPENERCDRLAVNAYLHGPLHPDEGYENQKDENDLF